MAECLEHGGPLSVWRWEETHPGAALYPKPICAIWRAVNEGCEFVSFADGLIVRTCLPQTLAGNISRPTRGPRHCFLVRKRPSILSNLSVIGADMTDAYGTSLGMTSWLAGRTGAQVHSPRGAPVQVAATP